jgi:hypothetical protein
LLTAAISGVATRLAQRDGRAAAFPWNCYEFLSARANNEFINEVKTISHLKQCILHNNKILRIKKCYPVGLLYGIIFADECLP